MTIVNMLDAKTRLSQLVEAIENGSEDEIILARNGKPAARIVPLDKPKGRRQLGLANGKYRSMTLEEFDAGNEEIAKMFEESELWPK